MSKVTILEVSVLNSQDGFFAPYKFDVKLEVQENLEEDMEMVVRYVGSAQSAEYDQVLDSVLVGPLPQGRRQFILEVPPPDPKLIPSEDAVGITVIILECLYREKRFASIGYFLCHEYQDAELNENMPSVPQFDKLVRTIFEADKRLTYYPISWDDEEFNENENGASEICDVQQESPTLSEKPLES